MACAPLYANILCDTGDNITLEEFINAMGPQWEIQCANINSEISIRELIHNLLDLAGMIPVVGWVFDGVNAGIYFVEGDVLNGCISMLGTIEFWGGCYALRIALKNGDSVSKIAAKKLGGCISRVKSGVGNVLDDIASVKRIGDSYEFVTADGIIFKMVDDDILYSTKSVIKAMANSTDELITCLKTKPEALFELVKETKKLDDGILFKLVDDTEVKIFKSDLTADMHTALVGENGLLVTGDYTEEMMAAGREAIENARRINIDNPNILSQIGEAAAKMVDDVKVMKQYIIVPEDGFQAFLERKYIVIRKAALNDVADVAYNTGLPIQDIIDMKNHLFLNTKDISVQGKPFERLYFQADGDVAYAWEAAQTRRLTENEKDWFKKLRDHELTEKKLMDEGMPLRDPSTWNLEKEVFDTDSLKNAHDKANITAPNPSDFCDYMKELLDNIDKPIYY